MNPGITLTPARLTEFLLHIAPVRPVFIWGAPGIGKSALVTQFADAVGIPCISLLGSQLAPEDLIGVPQIVGGKSRFAPPTTIAREEPYCLFLDELNACSHEVQKAFYSLIHERRLGEYELPRGSVVIGAGNRAQDNAIVKPMSSALINRMIHIHLTPSHRDWLAWASQAGIHPLVVEYIGLRPDHLWSQPPKHEDTFSSPRSWHMLSDALHEYGEALDDATLNLLATGCLSAEHAGQFRGFRRQLLHRYTLHAIVKGDAAWPRKAEERDILYFLAQSFRAMLVKELPEAVTETPELAFRAKALIRDLASISLEMAQMVVVADGSGSLPAWFLIELARDLPRIVTAQRHDAVK